MLRIDGECIQGAEPLLNACGKAEPYNVRDVQGFDLELVEVVSRVPWSSQSFPIAAEERS